MTSELCLIAAGWFAGGFVNGVAGFGAAMVAMPLIAPFIEMSLAVPSCTLIVLTLNCQVVWVFRKDIQWPYVKEICIGAVPGILLSGLALKYVSEPHLKAGMGGFIACFALWELFRDTKRPSVVHPAWGYLSGMLSSALGMAFGFNGPPMVAYVACSGCPPRFVKGVLGAGFIITGSIIVAAKVMTGQVDRMVVFTFLASTPAVMFGSKLGIRISSGLEEGAYRKVLFIALITMGIRIAWTALSW